MSSPTSYGVGFLKRTLRSIVLKGEDGERYRYVWDPRQQLMWVQVVEDGLYGLPKLIGRATTEELFRVVVEDLSGIKDLEVKKWIP